MLSLLHNFHGRCIIEPLNGLTSTALQDAIPLSESPYLMHPVEKKTNGLYSNPVAILDFASLYPTLYRAHNLCYTTLLHPDDAPNFPAEQVTETPIGEREPYMGSQGSFHQ